MSMEKVTFVVAANNREVLERNFLASPCLPAGHGHPILIQRNFSSAAKAYNDAMEKSENDLMIFVHQDMVLPEGWLGEVERSLRQLEARDARWGVLGVYGETADHTDAGHIYSHGLGILGRPFEAPVEACSLDEIVLILRKSSGLRFDDTLPHFHMYGADICMAAAQRGLKSYIIPAFCVHNTVFNLVLPKEFYDCYRHVRRTRREFLPIQTTCVRITRLGLPMYVRRLKEFGLRMRGRRIGARRWPSGTELLESVLRAGKPLIETT